MPKYNLNMTGEELRQLLEDQTPNGRIDTLPEALHALDGIRDSETVAQYIARTTPRPMTRRELLDILADETLPDPDAEAEAEEDPA